VGAVTANPRRPTAYATGPCREGTRRKEGCWSNQAQLPARNSKSLIRTWAGSNAYPVSRYRDERAPLLRRVGSPRRVPVSISQWCEHGSAGIDRVVIADGGPGRIAVSTTRARAAYGNSGSRQCYCLRYGIKLVSWNVLPPSFETEYMQSAVRSPGAAPALVFAATHTPATR
jgi:hypothetical protein